MFVIPGAHELPKATSWHSLAPGNTNFIKACMGSRHIDIGWDNLTVLYQGLHGFSPH